MPKQNFALGFCFKSCSIDSVFPFAASIRSRAPALKPSAATTMLCDNAPEPSTFPGTTMVSLALVNRASLLMLTTRRALVDFSRSSAILSQSAAFELVLSLRKHVMSSCNTGFVGPVGFIVFLCC